MKKLIYFTLVVAPLAVTFIIWKRPAVAPHATPTPTAEANIVIFSPRPGDRVGNPVTVTGKARVFESQFNYRLSDTAGKMLYENHAMANAPDTGQYGDFSVEIPLPGDAPENLIVEVFDYSAKDGSVIDLVSIPVIYLGD